MRRGGAAEALDWFACEVYIGRMDSLFLQLKRACGRLTKVAAAEAQARIGLHGAQALALLLLTGGARRINELAQDLDLGAPAATTLVARMEEAGLARRAKDEADSRASRVDLTEHGRASAEKVAGMIAVFDAALLEGLSPEEAAFLRRFLDRLSHLDKF